MNFGGGWWVCGLLEALFLIIMVIKRERGIMGYF